MGQSSVDGSFLCSDTFIPYQALYLMATLSTGYIYDTQVNLWTRVSRFAFYLLAVNKLNTYISRQFLCYQTTIRRVSFMPIITKIVLNHKHSIFPLTPLHKHCKSPCMAYRRMRRLLCRMVC